jgi:hypothetical protein
MNNLHELRNTGWRHNPEPKTLNYIRKDTSGGFDFASALNNANHATGNQYDTLNFKCLNCGMRFNSFWSRFQHQKNSCQADEAKDANDMKKDLMRLRNMDYVAPKHVLPLVPIRQDYVPQNQYTTSIKYNKYSVLNAFLT